MVISMRFPKCSLLLYAILLSFGIIGFSLWPSVLSLFYIVDLLLVFFLLFMVEHKNFDVLWIHFTRKEILFFSISFLLGLFFILTNIGLGLFFRAILLVYDPQSASYAFVLLLPSFILQFMIASVEEVTFRGYIMYDIEKYYSSKYVSVIVSSLLFSFLHIIAYAEGVLLEYSLLTTIFFFTNMFLGGVILALLKLRTKTLVSSIGFHMAWNFFGYHVFGLYFYPGFYKVFYLMPYYISGFEIGLISFFVLFLFLLLLLLTYPGVRHRTHIFLKTLLCRVFTKK
mgnify:CR=1 FL=1